MLLFGALALAPASGDAKPPPPSPREAKVAVYIDLINSESNHTLQNLDTYAGRIADLRKGPTCEEGGPQSWLSSMGPSAAERIAGYKKGLARPPVLPGDAPAQEMVAALEALRPLVEEASRYYFMSEFHEDGCKRGRALHPQLMDGLTRYARADRALRAYVDQYTEERDAAELLTLQKKYGPGLHYHHRKLIVEAKAMMRLCRQKLLDLAAVKARLGAYVPVVDSARAAVTAVRTPRNTDALYQGGYDQFVGTAGSFGNQVGDFVRFVERQEREATEPLTRGQDAKARAAFAAKERDRTIENLIITYNLLVQQSNNVMYSKSMK